MVYVSSIYIYIFYTLCYVFVFNLQAFLPPNPSSFVPSTTLQCIEHFQFRSLGKVGQALTTASSSMRYSYDSSLRASKHETKKVDTDHLTQPVKNCLESRLIKESRAWVHPQVRIAISIALPSHCIQSKKSARNMLGALFVASCY